MNAWTPVAIAELINDAGQWVIGLIVLYQIARGLCARKSQESKGTFTMTDASKVIEFQPSGRGKARCAPDPKFPNGIAIPQIIDGENCFVALPYPAPECGVHVVTCKLCGNSAGITAAGRPDDPVSFYMPCRLAAKGVTQ